MTALALVAGTLISATMAVVANKRANKIEAIKLYRELTNTGLAEAKAVIDRIEAGM